MCEPIVEIPVNSTEKRVKKHLEIPVAVAKKLWYLGNTNPVSI